MSFPPRFLDEIRSRVACSTVIGRRVRLVKRNREHAGLCPFHNEKTPSFTVNDDKGFFHCFGCGAHGDVIGFVMRIDHLSFPEAVERLAEEAGLELPRQTPEQAAREERAKTLGEAMEAAAKWFEAQLRAPAGRAALDYLQRQRGLDDATIERFRLGYAPEDRQALRRALKAQGFDDNMLIEASLLVLPEGGGEPFSFFRDRAMFAVTDRRGRVIAFGGRVMGDGKPKYINSRDTPLFDKGRSLYALDKAWEGVRNGAELVAAEGYMDVIALHAAGFKGAVAPLGTALTETQIELLWRMAPEPIVCLDGDEAGQRAALRAAERALPLLKPGHSLRFATLPPGEDPDTFLRRNGPPAFTDVLRRSRDLVDVVWENVITTRASVTPEHRAAVQQVLSEQTRKIGNAAVRTRYDEQFRDRLFRHFRAVRRAIAQAPTGLRGSHRAPTADAVASPMILVTVLNHPSLLNVADMAGQLEAIHFAEPRHGRFLHDLMDLALHQEVLHRDRLTARLIELGHEATCAEITAPQVLKHAPFARADAAFDEALGGLTAFLGGLHLRDLRRDLAHAEERLGQDMTAENWEVVQTLRRLIEEEEAAAEQRDLFETVPGLSR